MIERLRERHGALLFHQSGGCCDGSSPMCFAQDHFIISDHDVCLGEIGAAPFYLTRSRLFTDDAFAALTAARRF